AVEETLGKMACGGIYDQLGGGFHRYSVDQRWLVPHFEKMLYDNALLSRIYVDAYRVTGKPLYRRVAEETLDYVLREMTSPEGGFYSTQDADSEGHEGKFFVWTPAEVAAVMGEGDAEAFSAYYDVTPEGNFEGKNILNVPRPAGQVARLLRLDEAERLAEVLIEKFWDDQRGGFYFTASDHEALISRPKDLYDNATPSGNSLACCGLLRLSKLNAEERWAKYATRVLEMAALPMS